MCPSIGSSSIMRVLFSTDVEQDPWMKICTQLEIFSPLIHFNLTTNYCLCASVLRKSTKGSSKDPFEPLMMFGYISGGYNQCRSEIDTDRNTEHPADGMLIVSTGLCSFVISHPIVGLSSSGYYRVDPLTEKITCLLDVSFRLLWIPFVAYLSGLDFSVSTYR